MQKDGLMLDESAELQKKFEPLSSDLLHLYRFCIHESFSLVQQLQFFLWCFESKNQIIIRLVFKIVILDIYEPI